MFRCAELIRCILLIASVQSADGRFERLQASDLIRPKLPVFEACQGERENGCKQKDGKDGTADII
jgi:hypothetical protein